MTASPKTYEWAFDPGSKRRTRHLVCKTLAGKPPRYWTACAVVSYAEDAPLVRNALLHGMAGALCTKCVRTTEANTAQPSTKTNAQNEPMTTLSAIMNDPDSNRATMSASLVHGNVPPPPTPESTQVTLREGSTLTSDIIYGAFTWIVIAVCIGVLGAFAFYHFFRHF